MIAFDALAAAIDREVEVVPVSDRNEVDALILDDRLDGAVIDGRLLVMDRANDELVALVTPAWQQAGLIEGLQRAGLTPGEVATALDGAGPLEVIELDGDPDAEAREAIAFVSVVLMFVAIQVTGGYIMLGIFEEKTTKVVELVLSSVSARYLLIGKIVGMGVLGLVQVVTLAATALIVGTISGAATGPALDPMLLATSIVWFLLGYLLYGAVFAAGASLAPRQEDAQATLAPISLILLMSYIGVLSTAGDPTGTAARVVSWLPLTSSFAMPGRLASQSVAWWEVVGSMALTAVATVGVVLIAERIYVRSVIHTDRRLGWREAWSLES